MPKQQVNVRLDPKTLATLNRLAAELGLSQAAVVQLALRALAKRELAPKAAVR